MTTEKKILVIDDDPDVTSYLSAFLEDEGFEVVTAADGVLGLKAAQAEVPDMITLDITMPRMSGLEVLTQLRRDPEFEAIPAFECPGSSQSSPRAPPVSVNFV